MSRSRSVIALLAALLFGIAALIGFWPQSITVVGDASYSCGSGFIHSRHTWKLDTQALRTGSTPLASSSATPNSACPSKVYGPRDLAFVVAAFALVLAAVVALADETEAADSPTRYAHVGELRISRRS
jgi:hypothetical protein